MVLRELKLLNVSVQFEEEHIDTQTLTSELMVSVFGSLAQQESTSISQNLRMSYQRRMERGEFLTAHSPLGYDLANGCKLQINARTLNTTLKIHISLLLIVQPMIMYKNYFSTAPMIKGNPTQILPFTRK